MSNDLKVLADNRDALLLAEVGAWLHMLGKYHEKFVNGDQDYEYKEFYKNLNNREEIKKLLTTDWPHKIWKINKPDELKNAPECLSQFMSVHTISRHTIGNVRESLLCVLIDAHGRGSGTEKGVLNKDGYQNQVNGQVYLATAFGYEVNKIDTDDLMKRKMQLYEFLEDNLKTLKDALEATSSGPFDEWQKWRQIFIDRLGEEFISTVGDTRHPINDVSLWDQTAATVAFFKTEFAKVLLEGWKDPLEENNRDNFNYRIIRVTFDASSFISQSPRIGDILTRIQMIKEGFGEIKQLIEVDYPLGFEIYRDISNAVFLVPDVEELLKYHDNTKTLYQLIEERFNKLFNGEVSLEISLSETSSRNVFFFGRELSKSVSELSPTFSFLKESWTASKDKCTICQLRPQGYGAKLVNNYQTNPNYYSKKAVERKMCCVCMGRLQGRAEEWKNDLTQTIWIDEASDTNGRVALIVGKFNLDKWLTGEQISTLRNLKNDCGLSYSDLLQDFKGRPNKQLKKLSKYKQIGNLHAGNIPGLYNLLIRDEDLDQSIYSSISEDEKLTLAVWRKTPSFARIRRVWETTKRFWEDVEQNLHENVGSIGERVRIIGDFGPENNSNGLIRYGSYEAELDKVRFNIFVEDTNSGTYMIIENLQRLAKKLEVSPEQSENYGISSIIKNYLRDKNLTIYNSEGKNREKPLGKLKILDVLSECNSYTPAIPILVEPSTFMVIVPANKALAVVKCIQEKYEKEMDKVRNRLPMMLGMVFAKSHTPLSALMDAGRRMQRVSNEEETWTLNSDAEICDGYCILNFDNNISWRVSVKMGDNTTEDIWYPYFYVEGVPTSRLTSFKGPRGWLVHVKELKKGDRVKICPSRFDFEFLDSASRRFEVSYDPKGKRRDALKTNRPYLIEEMNEFSFLWQVLEKGLARNQIKNLIGLIETKRVEWQAKSNNAVLEKFAHDVLRNANWKNGIPSEIDELIKAAVSGKLKDIVELYMDILKVKTDENEVGGILNE